MSSRVIVKGLPREATEQQLRGLFATVGDVTDVKIVRTKSGVSRQFAFVGFKAEHSGAAAVTKLNRSFLGTAKLAVEPAVAIGDDSVLQRSWSRHTKKPLARGGERAPKAAAAGASGVAGVKDPAKLEEFLALARTRGRSTAWANDDAVSGAARRAAQLGGVAAAAAAAGEEDGDGGSTDSEEYADAAPGTAAAGDEDDGEAGGDAGAGPRPGAAPAGPLTDMDYLRSHAVRRKAGAGAAAPGGGSGSGGSDEDDDWGEDDTPEGQVRLDRPGARGAAASPAAAADAASAAPARGSKRKLSAAADGTAASAPASRKRVKAAPASAPAAAAPPADGSPEGEADAGETGRLFVRNLPFSASEAELRAHFSPFGPLADVKLPTRQDSRQARGFALLTFVVPQHAVAAMGGTDGRVFQGRILHVIPAHAERDPGGVGTGAGGSGGGAMASGQQLPQLSSFQREREEGRRKAEAAAAAAAGGGGGASPWSSLFTRGDTAVSAAAERMGVAASDVLDRDATNMAVRAALAEASVIAETKAFLEGEGVAVGALEAGLAAVPGDRAGPAASPTVLLVKNLPFSSTTPAALRELFSRHGVLARFALPPSRALALVEFADAKCAAKAFSALSYARFQRVPLYLQWAPEGVFKAPAPAAAPVPVPAPAAAAAEAGGGKAAAAKSVASAAAGAKKAAAAAASATGRPSSSSSAQPSAEEDATSSSAAAAAASTPAADVLQGAPDFDASCTLFVKNLAFATTEEGLRALFAAAPGGGPKGGTAAAAAAAAAAAGVRSVRIPRRRNPKYRHEEALAAAAAASAAAAKGKKPSSASSAAQPEWLSLGYGFVEFESAEAAGRALRALQGRELDGHTLQLSAAAAKALPSAIDPGNVRQAKAASVLAAAAERKKKAGAQAEPPAEGAAAAAAVGAGAAPGASSKLLVRNLAFEANRKDITELFGAFGQVKSVRLPKKFDGSHRGFAFVEFLTHAEAAAAKGALGAAHLYGRHLVLEWSAGGKEGEGLGAGAAAAPPSAATAAAAGKPGSAKKPKPAGAGAGGDKGVRGSSSSSGSA